VVLSCFIFSPLINLLVYPELPLTDLTAFDPTFIAASRWEREVWDASDWFWVISPEQLTAMRADIQSVIVGNLLGDGSIVFPRQGSIYFKFKQSIIHVQYFAFVFFILQPWLTAGSPSFLRFFD
jgi:hypothetical protein